MSGHSKWHNIRVKKTAADKARGKVYTRHAKLIEIVAQRGGDPDTNAALRNAIDNAKADSVPNANIERAIAKGTGESKGDKMEEVVYAAYGQGNAALVIECLTDNKNRTLSNVKTIISKHGGHFAESASVMWMFKRAGVVVVKGSIDDEIELQLIDIGAESVERDEDMFSVTTDAAGWTAVRDFFKQKGMEVVSAGLKYVPTQKADIKDAETVQKLIDLIDAIEEDDDVSEVHTNADIG
jgi:YebC/PmpR family DNA-binding regulatory protein